MFDFDFSRAIVDFSNFELTQLGDALLFGGLILLIGMATIVAVLCILWICLTIFKLAFHTLPAKKAAKKKVTPVVMTVEKEVETKKTDNEEIVAVIAATIAMAESDLSGAKFRVVSFRRV